MPFYISHCHGLGYYHGDEYVHVPLKQVSVKATIKELAAQVQLTQTFVNENDDISIGAVYSFPVPARAAVSGFIMTTQDGHRVRGVIQEKDEAKASYETAIQQGKTASLAEQQTADTFRVAVGNIPARTEVKVELVYTTELTEDEDNDSVRFHLPTHVGARYGAAPQGFAYSQIDAFLHISVDIEATSAIRKIGSPSHAISTELGPPASLCDVTLPPSNYAHVSLLSVTSPLEQDFVLSITAAGQDAARCVAEIHPSQDSVALAFTLVPKFTLPDITSHEFIFLVDRSGSMEGNRMAAARSALVVMLRALPRKGTYFQVASFGSSADQLWPDGSRIYDQASLDDATKHVDGMDANYGGTEIKSALAMCFQRRAPDKQTSIFVLTDGDAWEVKSVLDEVRRAVDGAPAKAPLRVYCLGIGDSASTEMCQGIARAGRGICMMVLEKEATMTGKIARMLKAAKAQPLSDLEFDWGRVQEQSEDEFELVDEPEFTAMDTDEPTVPPGEVLDIMDSSADPTILDATSLPTPKPPKLGPPPIIQQSPASLKTLFSGVRLHVYAILQGKDVPQTVILRGQSKDERKIELTVPVSLSRLPTSDYDIPPPIHALAARKIIQDYEDGKHNSFPAGSSATALIKAHVVRLGKAYAIMSRETSFVAIDESGMVHPIQDRPPRPALGGGWVGGRGGSARGRSISPLMGRHAQPRAMMKMSGASPIARQSPSPSTVLSSFGSTLLSSNTVPTMKKKKKKAVSGGGMPQSPSDEPTSQRGYCELEKLARKQAFDGSFKADVLDDIHIVVADVKEVLGDVAEGMVYSICAIAFIEKKLADVTSEDERVSWESILEKAKDYVLGEGVQLGELTELIAKVAHFV
ncbi:VIT-domain-containing protein [Cylindrobasidium torrendii FP15055 ss-10]|uniref:VIT-domain-containing protein n=1 Tax=Cylindrobasidium torrendii FP15055 ss-10 TaxID=1314674 RepID=A0A0D7BMK6_9AGAR|nr:VIT-domain-containing protein [Cylindrobasidium torrendii FP15055 ss-10]